MGEPERFQFPCPQCGWELKAPPELVGRRAKCKNCGSEVRIPAPPAEPLDLPDDLPDDGRPTWAGRAPNRSRLDDARRLWRTFYAWAVISPWAYLYASVVFTQAAVQFFDPVNQSSVEKMLVYLVWVPIGLQLLLHCRLLLLCWRAAHAGDSVPLTAGAFVASWGFHIPRLADRLNDELDRRGLRVKPIDTTTAEWLPYLSILVLVPLLNLLFVIPFLIFFVLFFRSVVRAAAAVLATPEG